MLKFLGLPMLAIVAFSANPAKAHPHLYAKMTSAIVTSADGKITAIGVQWNFDETYTQFAIEGLDANGNGVYEDAELKPLTDENIANLKESNYFVSVLQSGKPVAAGAVTDYGQSLESDRLTLYFILPLQTPVDAKLAPVDVKIYDPDFFIAFDYVLKNPVNLDGALPAGCAMDLKPLPTTEETDQAREFLSTKGTEWKPEQPQDFGSMFAQSLVVSCS